jgi:hypothetical protein
MREYLQAIAAVLFCVAVASPLGSLKSRIVSARAARTRRKAARRSVSLATKKRREARPQASLPTGPGSLRRGRCRCRGRLRRQYRLTGALGEPERLVLRIHEFIAHPLAGVPPRLDGGGHPCGRFHESHFGRRGGLKPLRRQREEHAVGVLPIGRSHAPRGSRLEQASENG